jgi:hypothetical protein
MSIILPALGVTFASFCIWLGVRIMNRRERWAKWTAVVVLGVLAYPLSLGPACWIASRTDGQKLLRTFYRPLMLLANSARNRNLNHAITRYSMFGAANGWRWVWIPTQNSLHDDWNWVRLQGTSITYN